MNERINEWESKKNEKGNKTDCFVKFNALPNVYYMKNFIQWNI